jgi:hypothetical protein
MKPWTGACCSTKAIPTPALPNCSKLELVLWEESREKRTLVDGGDWSCAHFVPHILMSYISIYY